jgi:hypothetical protein
MPSGLVSGAGLNKEEVNYRQHEKCKSCDHFYYPGSCDIVDGNISPDTVCDKWEVKPKQSGMDGNDYQNEYNKSKGE